MNREDTNAGSSSDLAIRRMRVRYLVTAAALCVGAFALVSLAGAVFYRTLPVEEYLVFHLITEFASIVVSFAIFTIGWYGYKQSPSARVLALALAFLAVGTIDFVHAMSYPGMPDFLNTNTLGKDASYWLAARFIAGAGLLAIPFIPNRPLPRWLPPWSLLTISFSGCLAIVLVETYFPQVVPTLFVPGQGLTAVKDGIEYLIMALYLAAIIIYWRRPVFGPRSTVVMQTALLVSIFAELSFTLYESAYDSYNILGHLMKVAAYFLISRAIFVTSVRRPYEQLDQTRQDLERSFDRIGAALASSLELEPTLDLVAGLAAEMLHAPYAIVALAGEDPEELLVKASHGIHQPPEKIRLRNNLAARVVNERQPVWLSDISQPSPHTSEFADSGYLHSAVAAPITRNETVLGIIAVYSPQRAAFGESEARLLSSFSGQAAIAIGNARLYESQIATKSQLQHYANQLSILHEIGLSLNRETEEEKLLKRVLEAAAGLTSAGMGIMLVITDDRTRIISTYYAPWCGERCRTTAIPELIHRRIARLVSQASRDVVLLTDLSGLRQLPDGHVELNGLLIGILRDTQGKIRGHFMLTDKQGREEFNAADEEVIALLAAESSVALSSAENFAREHEVAESLQNALLPETPLREDVEVGLLYRSAGIYGRVGGDFYDFIELGARRIAIVVGDVCGKGLEAAKYTAMIKYMLRAYLGEGMFPGDCMSRLNTVINEQVSIEKFVTMALAVIDTGSNSITYCSAGHPPAFICSDSLVEPLRSPQAVPLGVLPQQKFLSAEVPLSPGGAIVMYTDGLLDARPEDAEPFGLQRVAQALHGRCGETAQQTVERLLQAALDYSLGTLRDDIALVAVRFRQE